MPILLILLALLWFVAPKSGLAREILLLAISYRVLRAVLPVLVLVCLIAYVYN